MGIGCKLRDNFIVEVLKNVQVFEVVFLKKTSIIGIGKISGNGNPFEKNEGKVEKLKDRV